MQDSTTELHPFVKLAIAYIGIMAGFSLLGLVFYVIAARGEAAGSVPVAPMMYYAALAGVSVMTAWLLKNGRRAGAYLAFALLAVSLLAPVNNPAFGGMFAVIYWFAIPNAAVGLLLLKAARTLR